MRVVAVGPVFGVLASANQRRLVLVGLERDGFEAGSLVTAITPRLSVRSSTTAPEISLVCFQVEEVRVELRRVGPVRLMGPPVIPRHRSEWLFLSLLFPLNFNSSNFTPLRVSLKVRVL